MVKLFLKSYGIYEWLFVRVSAIAILLYIVYITVFIFSINELSYEEWNDFFKVYFNRRLSIIVLFFILIHTWIGMRHIVEDYIKSIILRKIGIFFITFMLLMYLLYGIIIIWSI